jgi:hypothetical protein
LHPVQTITSTTTSNTTSCIPATVSYSINIAPIISANCGTTGSQASTCHGSGGAGGYNFTTYHGVSNEATGNPITAPTTSPIYQAITFSNTTVGMPLTGNPLTSCQIAEILAWAQAGCPDN